MASSGAWTTGLLVAFLVLLVLLAVFSILASIDLKKNGQLSVDPNLKTANSLLISAAVLSAVAFFGLLVGLIVYSVASKRALGFGTVGWAMLAVAAFIVLVVAGLSSAAAVYVRRSSSAQNKQAYAWSVSSAVLGFVSLAVLVVLALLTGKESVWPTTRIGPSSSPAVLPDYGPIYRRRTTGEEAPAAQSLPDERPLFPRKSSAVDSAAPNARPELGRTMTEPVSGE